MNLTEIIKNAFIFPSKNLETLSVYAIFSLFSSVFLFEGVINIIFGIMDLSTLVIGGIYITISIIIGFITRRISIQCIKTGIDLEERLPDFDFFQSFGTGFKKIIITIVYFLIPAILAVVIGLFTNIFGYLLDLIDAIFSQTPQLLMKNPSIAAEPIYNASFSLFMSLSLTISIALIIFLIFSFFQAMAEARLANTGSLKKALNIYGAAKDITRIGVLKVIILSILIFIIVSIIEFALTFIFDRFLVLSILTIVITPYITLFGQRALGLLYSDIV